MDDVSRSGPALILEDFAPYRLAVVAHAVSRALSEVYTKEFGLSIPEWRVLANLGRCGPLNAGELAERSSMDKPKVTRALQRLEARGLVQRAIVDADRRQVRLTLTRRGRLQFRQIAALALEWEANLLGNLSSAERSTFDRVLTKLMRQVETLAPDGATATERP